MSGQGKFKKQLSLIDLTFIGLGAIFGSGWLFAASHVSAIAGPAGIFSWLLGGFAVLLLGIVYCELGAALPRAGGVVRYPVYSHGPLLGYLMGFITLIAFSSLVAIEVVAARQYAAAWFPELTQAGSSNPTTFGWLVQFGLLCLFFLLNYYSVKTFAMANNLISMFKFIVPLLVIGVLFTFFKPENFEVPGLRPIRAVGIEMAVSAGGVIFAYLGLTPIISVASEVKNPQRTIPIALILSVLLSTAIYVLLQVAFLGGMPTEMLANGWAGVAKELALPYRDIALALGVGWLAYLVVADAVISPSGCGNIYMNATPRVIYGWAQTGTFFKVFTRIDEKSGIPRPALWLTFALSVFWTLPFPSWEALINVVSAALVLSYAVAPVSVAALRRNAPDMPRPFRVKWMGVLGPLSFVIAALIVYWSGWNTVSWLLGLQILMFVIYLLCGRFVPTQHLSLAQQVRSSAWLIGFYAVTIVLSWLGSFGGLGVLSHPFDTLVVAALRHGHLLLGRGNRCPGASGSIWMPKTVKVNPTYRIRARCRPAPGWRIDPDFALIPAPGAPLIGQIMKQLHIIDSHTGGEPTRLVMKGFPHCPAHHGRESAMPCATSMTNGVAPACWNRVATTCWSVRPVLRAGIAGCDVCGVIFFNNAGYLGMCGHGTIGSGQFVASPGADRPWRAQDRYARRPGQRHAACRRQRSPCAMCPPTATANRCRSKCLAMVASMAISPGAATGFSWCPSTAKRCRWTTSKP
jgi:amino acid transporter